MIDRFFKPFAFVLLSALPAGLSVAPGLAAEQGVFSLVVENDVFANTDRNYTNGLKFSYVSPWGEEDRLTRWIIDNLWLGDESLRLRTAYGVGQNMFTPDDISTPALLPDQRPYAGWLYASYGVIAEDRFSVSTFDVELGIVGPSAQADWVQKNFHNYFDFEEPRGWDNQLKDEPGVAVTLERQWKHIEPTRFVGLQYEVRPHLGASVGNVRTEGFGGATLRVGRDLKRGSLPPRIRPSLAGSGFFVPDAGFSWYGFIGMNGRLVAQNIFLDGNTWRNSHSVDKKCTVLDTQAGLVLQAGRFQFSYTYIVRTEQYEGQIGNDKFGAVGLSVRM